MKPYRDLFGNPLTKKDVTTAVMITLQTDNPFPANIARRMKIGYGKAARLVKVLGDAGVTTNVDGPRRVILKNEDQAVNAALRQLKKGVA